MPVEPNFSHVMCDVVSKLSVVASEISQKFVYDMETRGMFTTLQLNVNAMTGSQMLQHFHIRQEHDKVSSHMIMKLKSDWKRHAEKRRASHDL